MESDDKMQLERCWREGVLSACACDCVYMCDRLLEGYRGARSCRGLGRM